MDYFDLSFRHGLESHGGLLIELDVLALFLNFLFVPTFHACCKSFVAPIGK